MLLYKCYTWLLEINFYFLSLPYFKPSMQTFIDFIVNFHAEDFLFASLLLLDCADLYNQESDELIPLSCFVLTLCVRVYFVDYSKSV